MSDHDRPKSPPHTRRSYSLILSSAALLAFAFLLNFYWPTSSLSPKSSEYTPVFTADVEKRDAVVSAFKHVWSAYERDAFGADEYHPISHTGSNLTSSGGIGYTIVDSLDSLLLMLPPTSPELARARAWVEDAMTFDRDGVFNTFETTIRVLGGLLSAYHLSSPQDELYLTRAIDLADRLLAAFDSPSGLPWPGVNLGKRVGVPGEVAGVVSTAEAATLQLELKYLSHLTDNDIYWEKAEKVMALIRASRMPHGLATIYLSAQEGRFVTSDIRLGSRGDSYYEYLLKQYLQTRSTEGVYREMYEDTMRGIHNYLVQPTISNRSVYTAELIPERKPGTGEVGWRLIPKQDHLVCFFGGSLMLGATTTGTTSEEVSVPPKDHELTEVGRRDWGTGVRLIETCMDTYDTKTGLSPEIVHFRVPGDEAFVDPDQPAGRDWYIKGSRAGQPTPYDARYILRPETVESLFIAFRLTGDPKYRAWGWEIFQAIEKHCKVDTGGYASVLHVDRVPVELEDKMETFLMSETLKYLFLLFTDADVLPLDEYVFNTEAHPLPMFYPSIRTGFT